MAVSKSDIEQKRVKRRERKEKIDKLTNWYMINLSWGVAGFIALGFVESGFANGATVLEMPIIMKILAAVFAVGAVLLAVFGKCGVIKNKKRAFDYSLFLGVLTLISLWIGFYAKIRNAVISLIPALKDVRSEWWYSRGFRYLLAIYLVVGFVVVTVKTSRAAKGK